MNARPLEFDQLQIAEFFVALETIKDSAVRPQAHQADEPADPVQGLSHIVVNAGEGRSPSPHLYGEKNVSTNSRFG